MGRKRKKSDNSYVVLLLFVLIIGLISVAYFYNNNDNGQYDTILATLGLVTPEKENVSSVVYEDLNLTGGIKIANWNLQIFGKSKASDPELMKLYAEKIDDYDIIFIQEIRDSSEESFPKLCDMLPAYKCSVSSRAGRSSSKEQYGVIFRKGIDLVEMVDYNPDKKDRWERPPVKVIFDINGYVLNLYNIHTKPDDVPEEMAGLEEEVKDEGNVVLFGDLNADCTYYNNDKETHFDSWYWAIKDEDDTTVAKSSCAYDRIIMNSDAQEEFLGAGIVSDGIDKEVSDHYLIWFSLKPEEQ